MSHDEELNVDWDKETDIMCAVRSGYDLGLLVNVDSVRVPGIVKRIDPRTQQCVGFIMHGFSKLIPGRSNLDLDQIKALINISLDLTNENVSLAKAC
ncbi:MAG: hypothetical protein A3G33_02685 [Omnitrophica bacterium RIFCSPLOWO2_12_FULL_44_17]|uniref:Uncharacterized protein n=1 Tax=Candidatus Danuiimicrobium aquiferis TaxID=1801832 RepID=A0A1G1KRS1_9BACT|nr:MAG: hypothetical protein A3E74_08050 [Omnitrophica bacterium RIFCSPHIGHO2_12_FULL_44_12]OGW95515.1 MAG: hypothetical protein A3G33_02685 [Omnitrophica bacterium RIFCSPLOWO2_12_FULL_44_17]OGX01607.1 MAG: hypothetical protein A3J12_05780 [Omnitrophica bacterium RIFCSPLOWO2_02_FULL_44_11]